MVCRSACGEGGAEMCASGMSSSFVLAGGLSACICLEADDGFAIDDG